MKRKIERVLPGAFAHAGPREPDLSLVSAPEIWVANRLQSCKTHCNHTQMAEICRFISFIF